MSNQAPIGERVQQARERLGLTQAQLAKRAGLTRHYVNQVELRGGKTVGLDTAFVLADALGVSLEFLAGREKNAMNYQTKPREIEQVEAYQWNPDNPDEAGRFINWLAGKNYECTINTEYHEQGLEVYGKKTNKSCYIESETWVYFRNGSFHNCSDRMFKETFEPIK